jgi:hypothetical protein
VQQKNKSKPGRNKDVNQENIDELSEILFQKADFKLIVNKKKYTKNLLKNVLKIVPIFIFFLNLYLLRVLEIPKNCSKS